MADIHIGKISQSTSGKGKAQLHYHIPIDTPVSGIAPTPESAIAGQLQQTEIDALAAGTLAEVAKTIVVKANQPQDEIVNAIKADWQNVRTDYNNRYSFEHKYCGMTINAIA